MAVTITPVPAGTGRADDVWGRRRVHLVEVAFYSSYPTGGEPVDFRPYGVQNDRNARYFFQQRSPVNGARPVVYDRTNRKLLAFEEESVVNGGALVEVPNGTDLSAYVYDVLIIEE
jgi:hypothetical protein